MTIKSRWRRECGRKITEPIPGGFKTTWAYSMPLKRWARAHSREPVVARWLSNKARG